MKIILDTNVFVSGVFFSGPPHLILCAWPDGLLVPVVSAEILEEYRRVGTQLSLKLPGVDLEPFLALLAVHAIVVQAPQLSAPVCEDPDDDKFLAWALASGAYVIVSGDRHLLKVSGYGGVSVVRPRAFVDGHLQG